MWEAALALWEEAVRQYPLPEAEDIKLRVRCFPKDLKIIVDAIPNPKRRRMHNPEENRLEEEVSISGSDDEDQPASSSASVWLPLPPPPPPRPAIGAAPRARLPLPPPPPPPRPKPKLEGLD